MKLPKNCKIELACSTDATRYVLTEPYLDIETSPAAEPYTTCDGVVVTPEPVRKASMVATTGSIMAIVPVEVDEHDTTGWVSPEALKAARKASGKLDTILGVNGSAVIPGGITMPRTAVLEGSNYPNYKQVLPSGDKHTFKVAIDIALLWKLAQAIGSEGPCVLSFNVDGVNVGEGKPNVPDVIMVSQSGKGTPTGGRGVIMPMRLN